MNLPESAAQPWARLHVVRGADPQSFRFCVDQPVELSVGSARTARLYLPIASVAPRQLEVLWDGAALWLQDPLRLGRTLVNGQPLNEWSLIRGEALVVFGVVRLWLVAVSPHPAPDLPDFASLERARGESTLRYASRRLPTLRLTLTSEFDAGLNEEAGS